MEDFEFEGKMYKIVEVDLNRCDGCAFECAKVEVCHKVPKCYEYGVSYIFIQADQNALQQEP